MTMTLCRTCGEDVHITHSEEECTGTPNLVTPDDLKPEPEPEYDNQTGTYF